MIFLKDVQQKLCDKYIANQKNLKALLKGEMTYPIKVGLNPPKSAKEISKNAFESRTFFSQWREFISEFSNQHSDDLSNLSPAIQLEYRANYKGLDIPNVPKTLLINNFQGLLCILSKHDAEYLAYQQGMLRAEAAALAEHFTVEIELVYKTLVDHNIFNLGEQERGMLIILLPQLYNGLGKGMYLRQLPLVGVDTKFIENNTAVIEGILDILFEGSVSDFGGLIPWLGCLDNLKTWLLVRPLCQDSRASFAGFSELELDSNALSKNALPAKNIIVVENRQSCLALPQIPNTIAVAGGGKNIAWMKADWLRDKNVFYWGDIDADGLQILGLARKYCNHVIPLMMDRDTIIQHQDMMVNSDHTVAIPDGLSDDELILFHDLMTHQFNGNRLEQEKIDRMFMLNRLELLYAKNG